MDELIERAKRAARRFGMPSLADDFSQEVALAHHIGKLEAGQPLYRFWVDYLRSQHGRKRTSPKYTARRSWIELGAFVLKGQDPGEPRYECSAPGDILWAQLLQRLEPRTRTIISLHYEWGYLLEEIAALLHVHPSRVAQLHTAAKAKLRKLLMSDETHGSGVDRRLKLRHPSLT